MRWFLDMNIILYYVGEGDKPDLNKKSKKFVNQKKESKFLVCYYIKDVDLPKWIKRQRVLYRELMKKLNDSSYKLYSSKESESLISRDRKKGIKFLTLFNSIPLPETINKIEKIFLYIEQQINEFFKNYIDEVVIPVEEIDSELKSHLMSFINIGKSNKNYSDINIISSAIQEHKNKSLTIITADRKDLKKDFLEEVKYHYNLTKKYPKIPEIKYLQNIS